MMAMTPIELRRATEDEIIQRYPAAAIDVGPVAMALAGRNRKSRHHLLRLRAIGQNLVYRSKLVARADIQDHDVLASESIHAARAIRVCRASSSTN